MGVLPCEVPTCHSSDEAGNFCLRKDCLTLDPAARQERYASAGGEGKISNLCAASLVSATSTLHARSAVSTITASEHRSGHSPGAHRSAGRVTRCRGTKTQ